MDNLIGLRRMLCGVFGGNFRMCPPYWRYFDFSRCERCVATNMFLFLYCSLQFERLSLAIRNQGSGIPWLRPFLLLAYSGPRLSSIRSYCSYPNSRRSRCFRSRSRTSNFTLRSVRFRTRSVPRFFDSRFRTEMASQSRSTQEEALR
jgi:hypothetical protein